MTPDEHTLEYLLAFDGRIHHLEQGFWIKFEIRRADASTERPHGLRYSFTLHDPLGNRLIGFDNAHPVAHRGSRFARSAPAHDHWHRSMDDPGRPYAFQSADQLLADFFAEVRRVLALRGVGDEVIAQSDAADRSEP